MIYKSTLILSSIVLFLGNISELDFFLKMITFIAYMIFMYVALLEKISTIKKSGFLEEYKGSWKRYLLETAKQFLTNLKNGK